MLPEAPSRAEGGIPHALTGSSSAMLPFGNESEAVVQGRSMGESIPPGSRIRMRPANADVSAIQAGSIVVHLAVNGLLVAHRVVAVGSNRDKVPFVITRGDQQTLCDMPIDVAELQGMVTAVWREGKWEPPSLKPASRGLGAHGMAKSAALGMARLVAWMTVPAQRRWISGRLLKLRKL